MRYIAVFHPAEEMRGAYVVAFPDLPGCVTQGNTFTEACAMAQEAVHGLAVRGLTVKVNTILVPGVNDRHVGAVARMAARLGAAIQNIIPLKPTEGTALSHLPEPSAAEVNTARAAAGAHLAQMTHCRRCRADAVGLLHEDRSAEMAGVLRSCASADCGTAERGLFQSLTLPPSRPSGRP